MKCTEEIFTKSFHYGTGSILLGPHVIKPVKNAAEINDILELPPQPQISITCIPYHFAKVQFYRSEIITTICSCNITVYKNTHQKQFQNPRIQTILHDNWQEMDNGARYLLIPSPCPPDCHAIQVRTLNIITKALQNTWQELDNGAR